MKCVKRIIPIMFLVITLLLSSTACSRLSDFNGDLGEEKETLKDVEEEDYLIPFSANDGLTRIYGYTDKDGKIVIEPRFKAAEPFYECHAAMVTDKNGKVGIIDEKGEYLIEPEYEYFSYSEGIFMTYDYEKNVTFAFDEKGNKRFEVGGYISEFSDGLSPYHSETEKGYVDDTGKLVLKMDYEYLGPFVNGMAQVSETYLGASWVIDTHGNDLTDKVSSGLRMFKDETSGLFGYKDKNGMIVIKAQFVEAEPFINGYAIANSTDNQFNTMYGVIDTEGNYFLEPGYCGIKRMKNGLIAVGEKVNSEFVSPQYFEYSKKALYTPDMKEHTDWIYYLVEDFDDQNVCVNDETTVLFIQKDLKQAQDLPVFKGQGAFKRDGSLLRGNIGTLSTVAALNGKIISQSSTRDELGDGITADLQIESPSRTRHNAYPVLSGLKDKELQNRINALIYNDMVAPYATVSEYGENPYEITIFDSSYKIARQKDMILIDQLLYEYLVGSIHPFQFRNTLYIGLDTGMKYEMKDLFKPGDEVYSLLSEKVSNQMKAKMEEVGYWEDHVTVTKDTGFALAEGGIILYYGEYELASYAAGMQEFFIPFTELSQYINTEGAFWKSFN